MPTTTNMGLDLPDVLVTQSPTWASDLNTSLTQVDEHDHSPSKGVPVPSSGININADLPLNSNNLTEARSFKFDSQPAVFSSASDNNSVYNVLGELYFRDSSGNNVKITQAGSVNVTGTNGIGGDYGGANPASVFYTDATDLYSFTTDPGVFANLKFRGLELTGKVVVNPQTVSSTPYTITSGASDANSYLLVNTSTAKTINLPDPTLEKRLIFVKDLTGTARANPITIAPFAAETIDGVAGSKTLNAPFGIWAFVSNGTNWFTVQDTRTDRAVFIRATANSSSVAFATTFTALPISTTSLTSGYAITRSGDDITLARPGDYKATVLLGRSDASGSPGVALLRVRDTTNNVTKVVSTVFISSILGTDSYSQELLFNVTDTAAVYQIQGAVEVGGNYIVLNQSATIDGESAPTFRIILEFLG